MTCKDASLRLAARLLARRNALRKALNDDFDRFRNDSEVSGVGDSIDAAVDSANDELCFQLVEHESRVLGQIEHALEQLARGAYARCEFCGGKIPTARLNALPYTNSCIVCQRKNERVGCSMVLVPDMAPWATVDENRFEESQGDAQIDLGRFKTDFSESYRWPVRHAAVSRSS